MWYELDAMLQHTTPGQIFFPTLDMLWASSRLMYVSREAHRAISRAIEEENEPAA